MPLPSSLKEGSAGGRGWCGSSQAIWQRSSVGRLRHELAVGVDRLPPLVLRLVEPVRQHSEANLLQLAAELGSDVPFFLHGGTAIGLGRGEELYPVDDVARLGVVVIKPSFGVGTAEAYGWLDADRAAEAVTPEPDRPQDVEVGWAGGRLRLANDLQAPVGRRHPVIAEMIAACVTHGAMAAAMSGSGSAVFGVFSESTARRALARLQRPDWLVLLTRTLSRQEAAKRVGL